jgi:peptidoglycan DL-endopeptidase CwlO
VHDLSSLNLVARSQHRDIASYTALKSQYDEHKSRLDTLIAQQSAQHKELAGKKTAIEADLARLYELRRQAYGRATTPSSGGYTGSVPAVSGQAGVAVRYAYGAIGAPYVWAGTGPGYDCSGLTMMAWAAAGVRMGHGASDQYYQTARIPRSALQAGDLVFYSGLGHVGIYVGGGQIIHSPTFGETVKLASVDVMPPYGYGRPG